MVGSVSLRFDFRCRNPFRLFVKERFLFDWERKYTSHFRNSNRPVNFLLKIFHLSSQNSLKIICTGQFYTAKQTALLQQNSTCVNLI